MTKFVCSEHPNATYTLGVNNDERCDVCSSMQSELPFAEVMEPNFHTVEPTMDEAELLGTATFSLITKALELSVLLGDEDMTDLQHDLIKPVVFWAEQLQFLIEQQTAKAGMGMKP